LGMDRSASVDCGGGGKAQVEARAAADGEGEKGGIGRGWDCRMGLQRRRTERVIVD